MSNMLKYFLKWVSPERYFQFINRKYVKYTTKGYINSVIDFFILYSPLKDSPLKAGHKKTVFFNISNPLIYHRYMYVLAKFFSLNGYHVCFPNRFNIYLLLNEDIYSALLIKERIVEFKPPQMNSNCLVICDNVLSPDYFSFLKNNQHKPKAYYIPMCQHPLMYRDKLWNSDVNSPKRKRSIFMAGNFNELTYRRIERRSSMSNIISRIKLYEFLLERKKFSPFKVKTELLDFIDSEDDHKCILIDRNDFDIPMHELRPLLENFCFFLACPGVDMPFAHNLIEAMSVGTIPLIQDAYASMFFPKLTDSYNAIVFHNLDDLSRKIDSLYLLSNEKIEGLKANVVKYYKEHLTPYSVVQKIEDNKFEEIYLQAELNSICLLEKQTANN